MAKKTPVAKKPVAKKKYDSSKEALRRAKETPPYFGRIVSVEWAVLMLP